MAETTDWQLVIFDCDGVLVDSEPIANRIFAELLTENGFPITYEATLQQFVGRSLADCLALVERSYGKPIPADFVDRYRARRTIAFQQELQPIPGVAAVLEQVKRSRCVASNSSPQYIQTVLQLTGLLHHFRGNLFSAAQVERGKPFPDVFLHAACQMGVAPAGCVVIEDSVPGVQAASAAGMTVFGYARQSDRQALASAGAHVIFQDMQQLPELLETGSSL